MIAAMDPMAPNACALMFLASVQCASIVTIPHVHRQTVLLRAASIGSLVEGDDMLMRDIWNDIEWMRRLLDEYRIEMMFVIERQKSKRAGFCGGVRDNQ